MIKGRIVVTKEAPEPDLKRMSKKLAVGMMEFWADQHKKNLQSDGTPLPPNKQGKPMSAGETRTFDQWYYRGMRKKGNKASAAVGPEDYGASRDYIVAFYDLRKNKGVQFHGVTGAAEKRFQELTDEIVAGYIAQWNGKEFPDTKVPEAHRKPRKKRTKKG